MKTREEYDAAAMLLGMWYDPEDHTFNLNSGRFTQGDTIDADTFKKVTVINKIYHRRELVKAGIIGIRRNIHEQETTDEADEARSDHREDGAV